MRASIYKGQKATDTYLFLPLRDDVSGVSDAVLSAMGKLEFVMEITLTPGRRLNCGEAVHVMRMLLKKGCYVQLPPNWKSVSPRVAPGP